jgi:acetyl-CoA acyltransferase
VESIHAGSDITLALGAEVQTTTSARQGGEYLARASHFKRQSTIDDFVFPAMFARRIKACMAADLITAEDLALLSVKAYNNANLNPLAHMHHADMTFEKALSASDTNPKFLLNPELKDYLKVSDCSQVSDGGAGVIICSEEGLRKLGKHASECIEVLAVGQTAGNLYTDSDPTRMDTTAAAAQVALQGAGLSPCEVQVAEVHDCFNISEVLQLEAMGFAERGRGVHLLREGALEIAGKLPVNTVIMNILILANIHDLA